MTYLTDAAVIGEAIFPLTDAERVAIGAPQLGPMLVRVADVAPELVEWLWPGRLALKKTHVLDGDPGLGKTTIMLDLFARLSRGEPMPDGTGGGRPAHVVIATAEDGIADTIRPRLEAARADLSRCSVIVGVRDERGEHPLLLPDHLQHLDNAVRATKAVAVFVDPLMAFLSADVNANRDQDVRGALAKAQRMADETDVALIFCRHLRKSGSDQPLYRGGGSIGIIGAARVGLLVAPDPEDSERRILAVSKNNLAPLAPALAFRLVSHDILGVARVEWDGATEHTAAQLLAVPSSDEERSALQDAKDFLADVLAGGPLYATDIQAEARQAGHADRTLKRAKAQLGVETHREGFGGKWQWRLSHRGPQKPIDGHAERLAHYADSGPLREVDA